MSERKPLWGSVSLNGGLWVVHFAREGTASSIQHEGYSPEVFGDCPPEMPVVRYDLSPENSVFDSIRGPVKLVQGHHIRLNNDPMYTVAEYVAKMLEFGVVVQTVAEMREGKK